MKTSLQVNVLIGALALATAACSSQPASQPAPEARPDSGGRLTEPVRVDSPGGASAASANVPATPRTTAERVARYKECWGYVSTRSWDSLENCYAGNANTQLMGAQGAVSGPSKIVAMWKTFNQTVADLKGVPQLILVNAENVVSLVQVSGTFQGALPPGMRAAKNTRIMIQCGHVIRWSPSAGQYTREELYADSATMTEQLRSSEAPVGRGIDATTQTVVETTGSAVETANLASYRVRLSAFNRHNLKELGDADAAAVIHDYTLPKDMTSRENGDRAKHFFSAFPDYAQVTTSIWAAGDYVVAQGTFEGTNSGPAPMLGIKNATKQPVRVPFIEIAKYSEGKLKESWLFYESMSFAQQLGLPVATN